MRLDMPQIYLIVHQQVELKLYQRTVGKIQGPLIEHKCPFGEHLWYWNDMESNKLAPCYIPGRLLGLIENTKNYIIFNAQSNKVSYSCNVIFKKPDTDTKPPQG